MDARNSGYIRVGFYDDFKGYDTVLISVDINGLREIEVVLLQLANGLAEFDFSSLKLLDNEYGVEIKCFNSAQNFGMLKADEGKFSWQLTTQKWEEFRELAKILSIRSTSAHQYLDQETGDIALNSLQVILCFNEYPLSFWEEHFHKCN